MTNPRVTASALRVLKLMLEQPTKALSGADVARSTNIGSGTLYPLLSRLEQAGWVTSRWEVVDPVEVGRPRRRLYRLTALGQSKAREEINEFQMAPGALVWNP